MVVFTCNGCGQSVKKNQVEKHWMSCSYCQSLSCMDCGKDFWGEEYVQHTKCITEEEKYSGKDVREKLDSRKGEKKQEQWMQQIHHAIALTKPDKKIRDLFDVLLKQNSIPRKLNKFKNFVRNNLHIQDAKLIDEVWQIFSNAHASSQCPGISTKGSNVDDSASIAEEKPVDDADGNNAGDDQAKGESSLKRTNRKKRKRVRSFNEQNDTEDVASKKVNYGDESLKEQSNSINNENDKNTENLQNDITTSKELSHKKRKHKPSESLEENKGISKEINNNDDEQLQCLEDSEVVESSHKKKKRKQKHRDSSSDEENVSASMKKDNFSGMTGDETPADLKSEDTMISDKRKNKHKDRGADVPESSIEMDENNSQASLMEIDNVQVKASSVEKSHKKKKLKNKTYENGDVSVLVTENSRSTNKAPEIEVLNVTDIVEEIGANALPKKKKHKRKTEEDTSDLVENQEIPMESNEVEASEDSKRKFHWTKTIKEILLQSEGHKLSLKKLQKKVLHRYKAQNGETCDDKDKLKKKFTKKCSSFKIENGFVTLDV